VNPLSIDVTRALTEGLLWIPAALLAGFLARRMPLGGHRAEWSVAAALGAHVAAMLCVLAWHNATTALLLPARWGGRLDGGMTGSGALLGGPLGGAALYALLTALAHAIHYARRNREIEAALTSERLTVLSMELRPQFLLNALNTAAELIHRDPAAADRMLTALGDLLDHAARDGRCHEVPLSRELELLQRYVEVERARFGGGLAIELAVARDALAVRVPPFLLQPFVENAVHHGIAPRAMRGTIRIVAESDGAMLRLDVIDDGVGFQSAPGSNSVGGGAGIANVRARLRELYGARQSVDITSCAGHGTTVTMHLPWRFSAAARVARRSAPTHDAPAPSPAW
jgi:two-component system, LytTR family, sensor kinase